MKPDDEKPEVVIVGGGPAGLMVAFQLMHSASVTIVDHKKAVGRKFLVAGDGGFNLTHSEPLETFVEKYDSHYVRECVRNFTPSDTRSWLRDVGIETHIGSSGKVFPVEGIKPVEVLNAILVRLKSAGVKFITEAALDDFSDRSVTIRSGEATTVIPHDFLVFALGGASWKKTGSTGEWLGLFHQKGIPVLPFQSSNSGVELADSDILSAFEGSQLKNVRLTFGSQSVAGDLTITSYGLEGKPVYASNNWLRSNDFTGLKIDFRPQLTEEELLAKLQSGSNAKKAFRAARLPDSVYYWLRSQLTKEQFTDFRLLAAHIKSFEPEIKGLRPLDEVISVVGGVSMDAIGEGGELLGLPSVFCCGEMLNWDAPTGGYLLQACFSSGYRVGRRLKKMIDN